MEKSSLKTIVENLAKQTKKFNAGEAHVELGGILNNPDLTAVISVYNGQNPAHKVLERIFDWAEENNEEIAEMIRKLSNEPLE